MSTGLPGLDPLTFPDAVFQGDVLTVTVKGRNLDQATQVRVRPAKGILSSLEPTGQSNRLILNLQVDRKTPPGEKYLWVESPQGDSNQLLFIVMM
jgi:hypothetical protein